MLIDLLWHHVDMFEFIVIAFLLALAPLAYFAGADSRIDDVARRRKLNG